ncbi:hypothetical protein, partial [Glaciimonas immobilis]|uniref:hypothetical protein n=1 Tax=Glaciimonas immobilis TaxID=728004 RepID=UPI001ADB493B
LELGIVTMESNLAIAVVQDLAMVGKIHHCRQLAGCLEVPDDCSRKHAYSRWILYAGIASAQVEHVRHLQLTAEKSCLKNRCQLLSGKSVHAKFLMRCAVMTYRQLPHMQLINFLLKNFISVLVLYKNLSNVCKVSTAC